MKITAETGKTAIAACRAWAARPAIKQSLRVAQYALLGCVVIYLFYRLTHVGWLKVIDALPDSPFFYLIFAVRYLTLPLAEIPTYEIVWKRSLWRSFPAFIRKRVYNFAVMGYSGEAFFSLWARRRLNLSDRQILIGVKDNNLISALVSNLATVLLVLALFATGGLKAGLDALPGASVLFALAFISAFGLALAFIVFRRKIIDLPKGVMPKLVAINTGRIALVMALHALLYASALPEAPIAAWFMFIALQLVLSRVPFLPNQDIVYLTAALSLSTVTGVPEAAIAGMLIAEAGLSQIFNISLFFATAHLALDGSGADQRAPRA